MNVKIANRDPNCLYPPFAELLAAILTEATRECKGKWGVDHWTIVEGLRTQDRQDYLYSLGRTEPGTIVTQVRISNHSAGLAADCYPVDAHGNIMWEAPEPAWEQYGHCIRAHGARWGGDWGHPELQHSFIDRPHCEANPVQKAQWMAGARAHVKALGLA